MNLKPLISHICCALIYLFVGKYSTISPWRKFAFRLWADCISCHPICTVLHSSTPPLLPTVLQACRTISILCSHSLHCGIIINSHLGEGRFPHHRMQWRFIATISKNKKGVGGDVQNVGEMEIVHIHHWLLGYYCLALHVQWGGCVRQWMTNAQNYKWAVTLEDREEGLNMDAMLCMTICAVNSNASCVVYNGDLTDAESSLCLTCRMWREHMQMLCSFKKSINMQMMVSIQPNIEIDGENFFPLWLTDPSLWLCTAAP